MNIKHVLFFTLTVLAMQFLSCSAGEKVQIYRAAERADIDIIRQKAGLIRTIYCDIYIEYVDNRSWKYLKEYKMFRGKGWGVPGEPCFHILIINTWNKPFILDKIEASSDGEVIPSEDFSFIKDKNYLENRYSISISSLFKNRRILSDRELLTDIDFENDSTEYRFNFIAPGDKISFFRFFSRIPLGKSPKIRVAIKYFDIKKVIDFDIDRFEYNADENENEY